MEEQGQHKKAMSEWKYLHIVTQNLISQKDTNEDLEGEEQPGMLDADSTSQECPILCTLDVCMNVVVEDIINSHDLRSKMRWDGEDGLENFKLTKHLMPMQRKK